MRKENALVLAVDAGDFGHATPGMGLAWPTTKFVASMLPRLKVDAWTPGERELYYGADSLQVLAAAIRAPGVSANVADASGRLLFEESVVTNLGSLRVGVTGVTRDSFPGVPALKASRFQDFKLLDPWTSLRAAVGRLRQRADLVVVLAHVPVEEADSLAKNIPGIDVIVVGHNPGYVAVLPAGDAMLVRPSNMGKQVARAHFTVESGRIVNYRGFEDVLKDGIRDEPFVARAVTAFRNAHGIKDTPKAPQ